MAFLLMIVVAIDASACVCYITRFTEENFATLIAIIFIYQVNFSFELFELPHAVKIWELRLTQT